MKKTVLFCILVLCVSLVSCSTLTEYADALDKWLNPNDLTVNLYELDGIIVDLEESNYELPNRPWEPAVNQVHYFSITNNTDHDITYTVLLEIKDVEYNLTEVVDYAVIQGAKYEDHISLKNYRLKSLNDGTNDMGINNVVIASGSTQYYAIGFYMRPEAGNEYMGGDFNAVLDVRSTDN